MGWHATMSRPLFCGRSRFANCTIPSTPPAIDDSEWRLLPASQPSRTAKRAQCSGAFFSLLTGDEFLAAAHEHGNMPEVDGIH